MPESQMNPKPFDGLIVDPQSQAVLGRIRLVGGPVQASQWVSNSGSLQGFVIVGDRDDLWDVWAAQRPVLLRGKSTQRLIRIMTYPADGEQHGFFDYVGEAHAIPVDTKKSKGMDATRRGLAYLQSLFGF